MTTLIDREQQVLEERPAPDSRLATYRRRNRFLVVALVIMAAALAVLAAWVLVDATGGSEPAVTEDVEQLLAGYRIAWNDADGAAFLDHVTDDYTFESVLGTADAEAQAAAIDDLAGTPWEVAVIGDPIMAGDGPWYVATAEVMTGTGGGNGDEGVSLVRIVDDGGTLRIARHVYMGDLLPG